MPEPIEKPLDPLEECRLPILLKYDGFNDTWSLFTVDEVNQAYAISELEARVDTRGIADRQPLSQLNSSPMWKGEFWQNHISKGDSIAYRADITGIDLWSERGGLVGIVPNCI